LKRSQLKVLRRPDGTVEIEGPPNLVKKYLKDFATPRVRGAGADSADLPTFFEKVGPRRGEDVLAVGYFLNRRGGEPDFDRGELSRAIARCPGKKKKVNAATVYALLGKKLLTKTRRGRYAITDDGALIVERRLAGAGGEGGASVDVRGLPGWLGSVKRERGSLIPTFAYYLHRQGAETVTRADLNACYSAVGKNRGVAPATLARLVSDGIFDRAERGRYSLSSRGKERIESLVGRAKARGRKRGPRRRRGPEKITLPDLRGASGFMRALDLGSTMSGRAWKLALGAGYFLEHHARPKTPTWKRAHLEAVFNRARGMEPPKHLSVVITSKLVLRKLVEPAGRRGLFRLTRAGTKTIEAHPTFDDATRAIAAGV
jgi:uncharacterized protein YdbL (DUF1318 family)